MKAHIPDLPTTVTAYLDADPDADPATIAGLFSADATVTDDGHTYRGRAEIIAWRADVAATFSYTTTRLRTERDDSVIVVVNRIEGNFPGGRIDLANRFTLDTAHRIRSLTIEPTTDTATPPRM
jgi:hypothetical protein